MDDIDIPFSNTLLPQLPTSKIIVNVVAGFNKSDIDAVLELANDFPVIFQFHQTSLPATYQPLFDLKRDSYIFDWSATWDGIHLSTVVEAALVSSFIPQLLPVVHELINLRKVSLSFEHRDDEDAVCQFLPQLPSLAELTSTEHVGLTPNLATCLQACTSLTCLPTFVKGFSSHCMKIGICHPI